MVGARIPRFRILESPPTSWPRQRPDRVLKRRLPLLSHPTILLAHGDGAGREGAVERSQPVVGRSRSTVRPGLAGRYAASLRGGRGGLLRQPPVVLVRPRRLLRQRVPLLLRPWHCGRLDVLRELPGTGNADRSALQLLDDRLRNPLVAVLRGGRRHDTDPAGVRVGRTGRRLFAAIPAGSYVGVCFLRIPGDLHRHRDRAPPGGGGASSRARHLARHAAAALHVRRAWLQPRLRSVRGGSVHRGLAPRAHDLVAPRTHGARRPSAH